MYLICIRFLSWFFNSFIFSLVKNCDKRPNYVALLEHPFIKKYETETVDMATYVKEVLAFQEAPTPSS